MRPYSSAQPFFRDNSVRRRTKAYSTFASLDRGCECGGFKKEIGKPGKADRLFRLMNINRVCHIVFCGRLEACFRGQTVVSIACPCSVLAKPCKSRTFQPLTVHTRPPFPFTFCFLPPVNSGGAVGTVFRPVGFRDEHSAADRTAFQVLIPEISASSVPICGKTDQRNHLQQTEKEMVWGQVWVSPSSRSIQFPSS